MIHKLFHALLAFRTVFLMNQGTIVNATLHTYPNTHRQIYIGVEHVFVDFELQS